MIVGVVCVLSIGFDFLNFGKCDLDFGYYFSDVRYWGGIGFLVLIRFDFEFYVD